MYGKKIEDSPMRTNPKFSDGDRTYRVNLNRNGWSICPLKQLI